MAASKAGCMAASALTDCGMNETRQIGRPPALPPSLEYERRKEEAAMQKEGRTGRSVGGSGWTWLQGCMWAAAQ
jgi:hypothetical protein